MVFFRESWGELPPRSEKRRGRIGSFNFANFFSSVRAAAGAATPVLPPRRDKQGEAETLKGSRDVKNLKGVREGWDERPRERRKDDGPEK